MKPPRAYARGIPYFFSGFRRSTLLRLPRGVASHSEAASMDNGRGADRARAPAHLGESGSTPNRENLTGDE